MTFILPISSTHVHFTSEGYKWQGNSLTLMHRNASKYRSYMRKGDLFWAEREWQGEICVPRIINQATHVTLVTNTAVKSLGKELATVDCMSTACKGNCEIIL